MATQRSDEPRDAIVVLRGELCQSLFNLTAEETQLRPLSRPGAWSIQQIVTHLLLTYQGTSNILDERLAKGTPTKKPATLAQRLMQLAVTRIGYFPSGRQAPAPVRPPAESVATSGADLAASVEQALTVLSSLIKECERVLGRGRTVTHAVLGPLSMQQWRQFQLVHGRHHIRQIKAIRSEHGL